MPGLSMGSAVGALVADACAGLSVSYAAGRGLCGRRRHGCGLPRKVRDRALSTCDSSRWCRRVLPAATDHAFARPLHLLHLLVAGLLYRLWYTRTPWGTACLLASRYHPGDFVGSVILDI